MNNKMVMILITIGAMLLLLVIAGLFPNLDRDLIKLAAGAIGGTGGSGVLAQGFADGMSKGATSSTAKNFATVNGNAVKE